MRAYLLILLFSIGADSFAQGVVGNWIGNVATVKGSLAFAFKINNSGGKYQATLDIPKQGLNGARAENTIFVDSVLTMSYPAFKLEYKGVLNNKNEIIGNMFKDGAPVVLNLRRGEIVLNRPQEPKPPFSYHCENICFKTSDNLTLQGTLTLPRKSGIFPVVIIISGSGPHNRDGEMFGHKPYFVIANELTQNGIGVLRFDERGVGHSEGNFATAAIPELSADITSAISYLKTRKDINPKKIGLLGHSIGGIIAPKVATENDAVSFIVLMAAPGVDGDQLLLSQKAALEKLMGFNDMQIAQGQEMVKGAYEIIVGSDLKNDALKERLNSFYLGKYGEGIPEIQRHKLIGQLTGNEIVSLIRSKPADYLVKVKCPVLAINGDKDFQVPAKENLAAIKKSVEFNGNKNVTIVEFQGLNHLFQECSTGVMAEYAEIEQTISPRVLAQLTQWITKHSL